MKQKPPPDLVEKPENAFRRTSREVASFAASVPKQNLIQAVVCLGLVLLNLILLATPLLTRFENIFLDTFFKLRTGSPVHPAIVYVEISEDSLQAIGRWPWPRHYHAVLTRILTQWKAKVIVFDVLFSEPSTSFDDGVLKEAIQESNLVYLPTVLETKGDENIWIHSLPEFESHLKGVGHINITPDSDGTLRRIRPFMSFGGETHPHLAVKAAFDYLKKELPKPGELPFPLDFNGNLLVNWAGRWKDTFKHYSYADLLQSFEAVQSGRKPVIRPEEFKDTICLIGLTAFGHADIKASPLEASYPAVGVHANVLNSILTNRFVSPAPPFVNGLCMAAIGLAASALFIFFRKVRAFLAGLSLGLVWIGISFLSFTRLGIWIDVFHPIFLILSLFIFSAIYVLLIRNREQMWLFQLATRDGLTGLFVIRHFRQVLNHAVTESQRRKQPLSLLLFDIDHFKRFNDTYGHQAGDFVLKKTAQIIQGNLRTRGMNRKADAIGRYGGEEFIVMLTNCTLHNAVFNVAERLRKQIESTTYQWENKKLSITVSIGAATLHEGDNVPDLMVRRADEALYRAKEEGRNRTCTEGAQGNSL